MPHKTQRIEPSFHKCLEELNFLKKKHDSQNWTIFPCDSRNWTLLSNMSHRNWTFLFYMTQRIEPFFFEYDSKNWTLFFWILTQRIELFVFRIWRKELNLFSWIWRKDWSFSLKFWHKSKNWTFFSKMTQRIKLFLELCLKEFNWLQNRTFLNDSNFWTWFFKWLELFVWFKEEMTQNFSTPFVIWLKNWTLFVNIQLNFFFRNMNWTKNFTLNFDMTQRIERFLFFFFLTQRFDFFWL